MPLIRITAPHFVAGLVAQDGYVIEAAPIIKYMVRWNGAEVARYCRAKGWKWERMDASEGVVEDNDVSAGDLRERPDGDARQARNDSRV